MVEDEACAGHWKQKVIEGEGTEDPGKNICKVFCSIACLQVSLICSYSLYVLNLLSTTLKAGELFSFTAQSEILG